LKKFCLIIISILVFSDLKSQSMEETTFMADSFFISQDYENAADLYRRIIFFSVDSVNYRHYLKLSECLFHAGHYDEALYYYDIAYNNLDNDTLLNEISFRKTLIYILLKDYKQARRELLNIDTAQSISVQNRYNFYHGVISFREGNYTLAEAFFIASLDSLIKKDSNKIREIFTDLPNGKPNPNTAKWLSIIFPGLGQLYAGDIRNAVNSFILNGILGGLFVYVSLKYGLLDAGLSIFPWFQRYYFGGFKRAAQIALKKQEEKREEVLKKIFIFYQGYLVNE